MHGINNSFKEAYLKAVIVKMFKEKAKDLQKAFIETDKEAYQIFRKNLIDLSKGGTNE